MNQVFFTMNNVRRILFLLFLSVGLLTLSSCSSTSGLVKLTPFKVSTIALQASPEMNKQRPVKVDIVFAFDKETLRSLEGFTASSWFTIKKTNLGNWGDHLQTLHQEITPGQQIELTNFPTGYEKAVAIVIFAEYGNPGLHRLVFREVKHLKLHFFNHEFQGANGKAYLITRPAQPLRNDQARR